MGTPTGLATAGLSHVAIRMTELARAIPIDTVTLGFPPVLEAEGLALVNAGALLGLHGDERRMPTGSATGDRFDPFRVGLDQLALAVPAKEAPHELQAQCAAGAAHYRIEDDAITGGAYHSFYDPDGVASERYALPE